MLLPAEPRIVDEPRARALTTRYLLPAAQFLEPFFLELRARLDLKLQRARPLKQGKPYPLGQCLEISQGMEALLGSVDPRTLTATSRKGYAALSAFLRAGGTMHLAWGDLRGQYFQNAFVAGTLYIDVANDTVVPTKPKVEILPFEKADFSPIKDFGHFSRIAEGYWQAKVFPNHVLPQLAPYLPLLLVTPRHVRFQSVGHYMLALTCQEAFVPSEQALSAEPLPEPLHSLLSACFAPADFPVTANPAEGREQALQACLLHRANDWHLCLERLDAAQQTAARANAVLARLKVESA